MAWLTRDADVLAALETDRSAVRSGMSGAVLLRRRPSLVQTLHPALDLDVAWCDEQPGAVLQVRRVVSLKRRRVARPCLTASAVVVAPAGAFERWRLRVGDRLEVKGG